MASRESVRFPDEFPSHWNDEGVQAVAKAAGEKLAAETPHDRHQSLEERLQGTQWGGSHPNQGDRGLEVTDEKIEG